MPSGAGSDSLDGSPTIGPDGLHVAFVNVFSLPGQPFSGNPLAVVTNGSGLDSTTMQALARQFNLSETTFVLDTPLGPVTGPATGLRSAEASHVRIFTPTVELPFAGHPTLGTAAILGEASGLDHITLHLAAGAVPVTRDDSGHWRLVAIPGPVARHEADLDQLARMVGLPETDVVAGWRVAAGVEQVLVQLRSPAAVRRAVASVADLLTWGACSSGESLVYLWSFDDGDLDHTAASNQPARDVTARLFFTQDTVVAEDPATGSAAANLGTLLAASGATGRLTIRQGDLIARPSRLVVDYAPSTVGVAGLVHRIGHGVVTLAGT